MGVWTDIDKLTPAQLAKRLAGRTHGTPSTYHAGCREECCRGAIARLQRQRRAKAKATS